MSPIVRAQLAAAGVRTALTHASVVWLVLLNALLFVGRMLAAFAVAAADIVCVLVFARFHRRLLLSLCNVASNVPRALLSRSRAIDVSIFRFAQNSQYVCASPQCAVSPKCAVSSAPLPRGTAAGTAPGSSGVPVTRCANRRSSAA